MKNDKMPTVAKTPRNIKLIGNFNRLDEMVEGNLKLKIIAAHFEDWLEVPVDREDIKVLVRLSEPLRTKVIPKKVTKVAIRIINEMEAERPSIRLPDELPLKVKK
jgi:hypothetical protein